MDCIERLQQLRLKNASEKQNANLIGEGEISKIDQIIRKFDSNKIHSKCKQRSLHRHIESDAEIQRTRSLDYMIPLRESFILTLKNQSFQNEAERQSAIFKDLTQQQSFGQTVQPDSFEEDLLSSDEMYTRACEYLGEIPCELVRKQLNSTIVDAHDMLLGDMGILPLCAALQRSNVVECVNFYGNDMTSASIPRICALLSQNSALKEINLSNNPRIGDDGVIALADYVAKKPTSLKYLDMTDCGLTDNSAQALSTIIKQLGGLSTLRLGHNELAGKTCRSIGKILSENITEIGILDLSFNKIRTNDIIHITNGLKENDILKVLNVSSNLIRDKGLEYIGRALTNNATLVELEARNIDITECGTVLFASELSNNKNLQVLDLSSNNMGTMGSLLLVHAIKNPESKLSKLILKGVMVNDEFIDVCNEIKETRPFQAIFEGRQGHYGFERNLLPKFTIIGDIDLTHASPKLVEKLFDRDPLAVLKLIAVHGNYNVLNAFKMADEKGEYSIFIEDIKKVIENSDLQLTKGMREKLWLYIKENSKHGIFKYAQFILGLDDERAVPGVEPKKKSKKKSRIR